MKLPPAIIPENCQQSLQISTKTKILPFPAVEAHLNARIPDQLDVFESGGYVFLREPTRVEGCSLLSIDAGVQKFGRVHAW